MMPKESGPVAAKPNPFLLGHENIQMAAILQKMVSAEMVFSQENQDLILTISGLPAQACAGSPWREKIPCGGCPASCRPGL